MKLFVGFGYYDFATPFYPVEWTLAHMRVSDEVRKNNISRGYYASGHMVYIDQKEAAKYHADLVEIREVGAAEIGRIRRGLRGFGEGVPCLRWRPLC